MSCLRNEVRLAGQETHRVERLGGGEGWEQPGSAGRALAAVSGRMDSASFLPGRGPLESKALKEPSQTGPEPDKAQQSLKPCCVLGICSLPR